MRCPACGFDNLIGTEVCDNCGADLAGHDVPEPATTFQGRLLGQKLDEIGVPDPTTVRPDLPAVDAVRRMQEGGIDCLLVTVDDRLIGIFTDRDAVVRAAGKRLDAFAVRDFMTPDPAVLRHDDTVAVAIHKMAVGGFRHIPIVDGDRPLGVVTARDIFRHLAEMLD